MGAGRFGPKARRRYAARLLNEKKLLLKVKAVIYRIAARSNFAKVRIAARPQQAPQRLAIQRFRAHPCVRRSVAVSTPMATSVAPPARASQAIAAGRINRALSVSASSA